jgi:hypothetical protein
VGVLAWSVKVVKILYKSICYGFLLLLVGLKWIYSPEIWFILVQTASDCNFLASDWVKGG